jgi:hypothetical protein
MSSNICGFSNLKSLFQSCIVSCLKHCELANCNKISKKIQEFCMASGTLGWIFPTFNNSIFKTALQLLKKYDIKSVIIVRLWIGLGSKSTDRE